MNLLGFSDANQLHSKQLGAFYAFWYDSEVQNGGHLQYFYNRGIDEARRAEPELRKLDVSNCADILWNAIELWDERARRKPGHVQQYIDDALEGEFQRFDLEYYSAEPPLIEILQQHLEDNQDLYVEIVK